MTIVDLDHIYPFSNKPFAYSFFYRYVVRFRTSVRRPIIFNFIIFIGEKWRPNTHSQANDMNLTFGVEVLVL